MSLNAAACGACWVLWAMAAGPTVCEPASAQAMVAAAAEVGAGGETAAAERLRRAAVADAACRPLSIAAWSLRGWLAARAAAIAGGTPDSLADLRRAVEVLGTLGPPRSAAGYAAALLHAAAAAAQDEREEMALWLDHARGLATTGDAGAPHWPLPVDRAEGELWLGVDDFELAELAFSRALAADDSAAAWAGLARARQGRGDAAGACAAWRRVTRTEAVAPVLAASTARALERCAP